MRGAVKRSETHSETRTALCNAVKRTVKHTVKHSAKRCNLQCFAVLSRSKGCCIQKSPSFFLPASTKRRKLPRFVLCFTVRFTAFHSAVRVSLHSTALRVFHFLFAVSWVGGAAIVLGKRRGVECPLPPHAAMLDKYLAFVTMKRF